MAGFYGDVRHFYQRNWTESRETSNYYGVTVLTLRYSHVLYNVQCTEYCSIDLHTISVK
jgi:hypothetical protein